MKCANCHRDIGETLDRIASIAILAMGDEYVYSYFRCSACEMYTIEQYHDHFTGDDDVSVAGPISREAGEQIVELIRQCPDPQSKNCDCSSHRALYSGRVVDPS